jgi:hypothetical protein
MKTDDDLVRAPIFGFRFSSSIETFVYEDELLRPTWEPRRNYRLSAEHRRQLCVHLAAHAAISWLGGLYVYMLAVAGEGVRSWSIGDRKSNPSEKMWGRCSTSDFYCNQMSWDRNRQIYVVDRERWESKIAKEFELYSESLPPEKTPVSSDEFLEGRRQQVRAHVCGYLAGHVADGITVGMSADEALRFYERRDTQAVWGNDVVEAEGLADLLPSGEYENAVRLTEEALRRPEVWNSVMRLAGDLQRFGLLERSACENDIDKLLPSPEANWPPAVGIQA